MGTRTPAQRLADHLLGLPVDEWITRRRHAGASWRTIAADLARLTAGQVAVSHMTVRDWAAGATAMTAGPTPAPATTKTKTP